MGVVTVRIVDPLIVPEVAVIVLLPTAKALAKPALLTVATDWLRELQVTEDVRSCLLPSLNVAVAVNCCAVPEGIEGLLGVTAIALRVGVTVSLVVPVTEPELAIMFALPGATPVAKPAALTVATVVDAEVQVTEFVRSCLLPSLRVPVAVNCCVAPWVIEGVAGVTASDAK